MMRHNAATNSKFNQKVRGGLANASVNWANISNKCDRPYKLSCFGWAVTTISKPHLLSNRPSAPRGAPWRPVYTHALALI